MTVAELSLFLQILCERLTSVDLMDFARRLTIEADLDMLETTLSEVQEVLSVAEKQTQGGPVKRRLDELKHVAYDADDVIDGLETEALRWKIDEKLQQHTNQVRDLSSLTNVFLSKIEGINKKLDGFAKRKDRLGLKEVVEESSSGVEQRTQTTSLVNESIVYGRERDVDEILNKFLLSDEYIDDGVCVIPIVGIGGAGKTTLAQVLYNDERVPEHFDLKAWVCVSDEFDVKRVTKSILESATGSSNNLTEPDPLQVRLKDELNAKKFLLVLDDVWSEKYSDWDELRKPFRAGALGSKIIVTTRSEKVASIMGTVPAYNLGLLSDEDCWSLFRKQAFAIRDLNAHPQLEVIRKKIVKKCRGLPLAAKALGGLLGSDIDKWEDILDNEIWHDDKKIWQERYQHLPAHLKQCIAYCSILPKDYEFEKEELVLLWMAEGFVQAKGQQRMEDVGEEYFCDLFQRSFFQQSNHDESKFIMHDLIKDLSVFEVEEICLRLEDRLQGNMTYNVPKMARHSSYVGDKFDRNTIFEAFHEVKCLRTFLALDLMRNEHLPSYRHLPIQAPYELLSKLVCLRVLCLRRYLIIELPDSIGNLKHLRLPESTITLVNLQTLLLVNCICLIELPQDLGNLINLRHLDIRGCNLLKKMPHGIDRLTSLQTLTNFVVGKNSGSKIRELDKLHIRGRLLISKLENVVDVDDAMETNLKNKQHLQELCLSWSCNTQNVDTQHEMVLEYLQPHMNIKDLTIKDYSGITFPIWMGHTSFCNIVSLKLYRCSKCEFLPPLGQLPSLVYLKLRELHGVKSVGPEFYGHGSVTSVKPFRSLKEIEFWNMQGFEEWSGLANEGETFPCLRKLEIVNCYNLRKFSHSFPSLETLRIVYYEEPSGFLKLPSLCELDLANCGEKMLQCLVDINSLTSVHINKMPKLVHLPDGILQCSSTLKELSITDCFSLRALSNGVGLPHLTSLQCLEISKCPKLVSLSIEDTGIPTKLEYLVIRDCDKLEKLLEGLHDLPFLRELKVKRCPSLLSFPKRGLPSLLRHLEIEGCENLKYLPMGMISNTSLQYLKIDGCSSLTTFPKGRLSTSLEHLIIRNCKNLESLSNGMHNDMSLKHLEIQGCHSLTSFLEGLHNITSLNELIIKDCPIMSFPNGGLPTTIKRIEIQDCWNIESLFKGMWNLISLDGLKIRGYTNLVSFPKVGLFINTLKSLLICECKNLKSLPDWIYHLTSLQDLEIHGCHSLVSFPKGGLLTSLIKLYISGCPDLVSFPEGGLLDNLKILYISECPGMVSFPECLLPTTLTNLTIKQFSNLESLPKRLQKLTCLEYLDIRECDKLASFPGEGLPAMLCTLRIEKCPLLIQRCQKEKGEDWHMIAHIPYVEIR